MKAFTAVKMAHFLIKDKLAAAERVIDATAGKGNDTLFLARHSPPTAIIHAFDIQQTALDKTRQLLEEYGLSDKVNLILDSHTNILHYGTQPADIIMFNLGYLPGATHCITTTKESTLEAVRASMDLLAVGGILTIAVYHGHPEGQQELEALHCFLENIPQISYSVASWQMINQINCPPVLYVIEKLRGDAREGSATI